MTLTVTTPPTAEPVSLAEAKAHLRVTIEAEDDLIAALVTAARQRIEAELGLALISTGFRESFDCAPDGPIRLSRAPLIAVAEVAVAGADGAFTAIPAESWIAKIGAREAEIAPLNLAWPAPVPPVDGLRVTFTAGFGPDADHVPEPLKQAVLALVAHAFDHRGDAEPASLPPAEPWLAAYRRVRL